MNASEMAELIVRRSCANKPNEQVQTAQTTGAKPILFRTASRLFFDLPAFVQRNSILQRQYESDEWSFGAAFFMAGGAQFRWAGLLLQCPDEGDAVGEARRADDSHRGSYILRVDLPLSRY